MAVKAQSFKGAKVWTRPNQSMSLREIIIRFTRRESLPVEKEGTYHEGFGDLEKAQREDITVRMERAAELKARIKRGKEAFEKREEEAKKAVESPPSTQPGPQAPVTGSGVGGQAPPPSPTPTK